MIARAVFAGLVSVWLTLAAADAEACEARAGAPRRAGGLAVQALEHAAPAAAERSNGRLMPMVFHRPCRIQTTE